MYLTHDNHRQYVCYNNSNSELKEIKCGVLQGSILGPLLFIVYISNMCDVSKLLHIILFADDTTIFYSASNIDDATNVTQTTRHVVQSEQIIAQCEQNKCYNV